MFIEPFQAYLIIPKVLQTLLFALIIKKGLDKTKNISWNNKPFLIRLIMIGMTGWTVYISLDLFLFLIAPLSLDGISSGYFSGYALEIPSLFLANLMRDLAFSGAMAIVWAYFLVSLTIRFGEAHTKKFLLNRIILSVIIAVSVVIVGFDRIGVTISNGIPTVDAVWDGMAGFGLLMFISLYLFSALMLFFTLKKAKFKDSSIQPKNIRFIGLGTLFMALGNIYWLIVGLLQLKFPILYLDLGYRVSLGFLGHLIWTLSPIFTYKGISSSLEIEPKKGDYEHKGLETFHQFVEHSLLGMIIFRENQILIVNDYLENLLSYPKKELESWSIGRFVEQIHPEDRSKFNAHIFELSLKHPNEERHKTIDMRVFNQNEEMKWWRLYSYIFPYNMEFFTQSIVLDITQQKEMEAKVKEREIVNQKIESLALLAGGIAHDFNNLLMGIIGNIDLLKLEVEELLKGNEDHHEIKEIFVDLEQAGLQTKQLTNQLLTFSRGGSPVKNPTSLEDLVQKSASFVLRGSKSKYTLQIDDDLPHANIDATQISQVLNNLLINADQAMEDGGIISIDVNKNYLTESNDYALSAGNYIQISIEDQGPGIPPENWDKIFVPYFSTKPNGTGLGLATSWSIIRQHGGNMMFQTGPTGTIFEIYLPVATDITKQDYHYREIALSSYGKVLLMDDNEEVLRVLSKMLIKIGFNVVCVTEGKEAINIYKLLYPKDPFRFIIVDLTIPGGMGGKEVVDRLYEFDPEIIAIISSGYSNDEVMAQFEKYHFAGVLSKPYTIDNLRSVLANIFSKLE